MVGVDGLAEGGDGRGHLETVKQDFLLSLEEDVLGPFDNSGEVSLGSHGVADLEVSGVRLEEGVLGDLLLGLGSGFLDLSSLFFPNPTKLRTKKSK